MMGSRRQSRVSMMSTWNLLCYNSDELVVRKQSEEYTSEEKQNDLRTQSP